jgi:hypothetical protein
MMMFVFLIQKRCICSIYEVKQKITFAFLSRHQFFEIGNLAFIGIS